MGGRAHSGVKQEVTLTQKSTDESSEQVKKHTDSASTTKLPKYTEGSLLPHNSDTICSTKTVYEGAPHPK